VEGGFLEGSQVWGSAGSASKVRPPRFDVPAEARTAATPRTADRFVVAISARNAYIRPMSTAPLTKPCVICGKPQGERFSPFCSKRCADVDLHRWLAGVYAIPAEEEDPDDPPGGPARDAGDP
jgi:endogenous inhibitor of DNA gyrase (YacG/DUF329 family)